jgi:hypothetical protein
MKQIEKFQRIESNQENKAIQQNFRKSQLTKEIQQIS